jgi:hypothetical protein
VRFGKKLNLVFVNSNIILKLKFLEKSIWKIFRIGINLDLDSTRSAHVTIHQLSNINKTVSGQMEYLVFGGRDFVMSPKL